MLAIAGLQVSYGRSIAALEDVSLGVEAGSIVALLGANGAGKSTTLKAVSGVLKSDDGRLTAGSIRFEGAEIQRKPPDQIVNLGIVQVPEGRRLFTDLTVNENLLTGACRRPQREVGPSLDKVYQLFPRLQSKRKVSAGYLSGGEQQMVAIGRALMAKPKVLLLDEPSLGLAPQIVDQIFETLQELRTSEGLTVLLVEQNAAKALSIADRGYIMEGGRIVLQGTRSELLANDLIRQLYLGLSSSGTRTSFRQPTEDPSQPSALR